LKEIAATTACPPIICPGRWRITAELDGFLDRCDANAGAINLKAVLEIGVG